MKPADQARVAWVQREAAVLRTLAACRGRTITTEQVAARAFLSTSDAYAALRHLADLHEIGTDRGRWVLP